MNSDPSSRRAGAEGIAALVLCLCVLAFQTPPRAAAQAGNEAQSAEYRDLIEQALSEFKHKNWPEARVLFRRAHELSPSARTLRGIGMVSYEMRDYVNAVLALSSALGDTHQALNEAQRKECETLLSRSRTFVGSYTLKLEPHEADVTLDGAQLAHDAEGHVLVPFGEHTVRATAAGYQDSTSKLMVQGGEHGELRVVLYKTQALAAAAAPGSSVELVQSRDQAAANGGAQHPQTPAPQPHGFVGHGIRYSWLALGMTAALGGAAAGTWFSGQHKVDQLDSSCKAAAGRGSPCQHGGVDTASVTRHEHATNALLGLTAAGLIATGVLLSLEWPTEHRSERRLSLDLAPQRLSVHGSF